MGAQDIQNGDILAVSHHLQVALIFRRERISGADGKMEYVTLQGIADIDCEDTRLGKGDHVLWAVPAQYLAMYLLVLGLGTNKPTTEYNKVLQVRADQPPLGDCCAT
jgi:hypothetical protein